MGLWKKIKQAMSKIIDAILGSIFKPLLTPVIFIHKIIKKIFDIFMKIINLMFSLVDVVMQLIDFFLKFVDIFIELITNIKDYILNPFKFFIVLIQFFILFISFAFSFLYHSFAFPAGKSSLMDLKIVELALYGIILVIYTLVMIVYSAYWFIWCLIIEYIILGTIDSSTGGFISSFMYRYFIACENPPDAWYMTPSWHKGNKNAKYIFAFNKCAAGYSTNNMAALFCKVNNDYELTMCPHANLYRAEKDLDTIGHFKSKSFDSNKYEYLKLKPNRQNNMINDYKQQVSTNNNACRVKMESKTNLLKSICMKTSDKTYKKKIQHLCKDIFCSNDGLEPLCHKLSHTDIPGGDNGSKNNYQIITYLFMIIILMVLATGKFLDKRT